jgi:hypothetical protein
MRKRFVLFSITSLLVFAAAFQGCQSSKTSTASKMLKFDLQKGKGYDYETQMSMDEKVMGQTINMDMSTYYSMNVVADSGDDKTITTSIDRFKIRGGAGGFNLDVDTDNPPPPGSDSTNPMQMISRVFSAIKGRKFSMTVNPEGEIVSVKGFEDLATALVDSMGLSETEKEKAVGAFNQQFNGSQIKGQLDRFWYIFPNKKVKVGDSWDKTSTVGGSVPGTYHSTYTVKEIEGDMVTLDEKTKVDIEQGPVKMGGTVNGTLVVDSKVGLVVTGDQDMNLSSSVNGQNFEIKAKIKIKGKESQ